MFTTTSRFEFNDGSIVMGRIFSSWQATGFESSSSLYPPTTSAPTDKSMWFSLVNNTNGVFTDETTPTATGGLSIAKVEHKRFVFSLEAKLWWRKHRGLCGWVITV